MKKIFTLIAALTIIAATLGATEPRTYTTTVGTVYEKTADGLVASPITCDLILSDSTAVISFTAQNRLRMYIASDVQRVSDCVYEFEGLHVTLPSGDGARAVSAWIEEGLLTLIFKPDDGGRPITYVFDM